MHLARYLLHVRKTFNNAPYLANVFLPTTETRSGVADSNAVKRFFGLKAVPPQQTAKQKLWTQARQGLLEPAKLGFVTKRVKRAMKAPAPPIA